MYNNLLRSSDMR